MFFSIIIVNAATLKINIIQPENSTNIMKPTVIYNNHDINYTNYHTSRNLWIYNIDVHDDILKKTLNIKLDVIPNEYQFYPLILEINYFKNQNISLKLEAKKLFKDSSASKIRKIYKIKVTSLSRQELLSHYQEFRFIANKRIERTKTNKLHFKDIQGVFKYLELIRALNNKHNIVPPNDINIFTSWFEKNIENTDLVKNSSIKLEDAKMIIEEVKNCKAERFKALWKAIENEDKCKKKYKKLLAYQKLLNDEDSEDQKRIKKVVGQYMVNILSAIAKCLSKNIRCDNIEKSTSILQIDKIVKDFEFEIPSTNNPTLQHIIDRDVKTLKNLKNSLNNSIPTICKE